MIIDARKMMSDNWEAGECAVCGGVAQEKSVIKKAVSSSFTDWQALMQGTGRKCCPACEALIKNTMMRNKCIVCTAAGTVESTDYNGIHSILREPPDKFVISIPYSYKRHHWLYAGISTSKRMLIGTDTATVEYIPSKHASVLDAIEMLIKAGVSSRQIESGNYHPSSIAIIGAGFEQIESIISQHRGSGLVRLLVKISPREKFDYCGVKDMRTTEQENAAFYLRELAAHSNFRASNGMQFWGGFFEARVNRVAGLSFDKATNKLMTSLQCSPNAGITAIIDNMSNEQKDGIMKTLAEQPKVCISLAYSDMKEARAK